MDRLKNKIAAITGAGGGIGLVAAKIFAKEGATVLILELDKEKAEAAAKEIVEAGGKAEAYPLDISSEDQVKDTFQKIKEKYGRLDVLYNNASVFWGKKDAPLDVLDMSVFERVMKINLFGLVYCSKYAIPLMKENGGSIINTGSSAAVTGVPGSDAYTAAKGGTLTLTRSMAVEYGGYNIRTNCICPAAIQTPMVGESNLGDPNFDDEFFRRRLTPLHRWGRPEEIANTALFLASDEGTYFNGAIFTCDGGITINGNVNKA